MAVAMSNLVGTGIYTLPDAARLSKVSSRRIRYWLQRAESEGSTRGLPRLWTGQHRPIADKMVLGFLDLQEVRFVGFSLCQTSPRVPLTSH